MLSSKWLYVFLGIALILVVLYFSGRKSFHAEIVIPASPDKVWSVLTDEQGYRYWNPLLVPKDGSFRSGSNIIYRMTQPNGKISEFTTIVVGIEKGRLLKQVAGMPLVLTADHEYRLEPVQGGTRVIQHEVDNGLAMHFWDSSWVQPTYEKVNEALKARVIALNEK